MADGIYIAQINIEPHIEAKINEKHDLSAGEVREALVLRRDVRAGWEDHERHGRRLVAYGRTYFDRPVVAALVPVTDAPAGTWRLKTARSPAE